MQIELRFRHKWLKKEFQKEIVKLSSVYGRDIVANSLREFCWYKLMHDQLMVQKLAEKVDKMIEQKND
jgi:hypothetical protein